ncbi:MAG: hypothetical protein ACREDC_00360 [Bradyrhizobium sp.]
MKHVANGFPRDLEKHLGEIETFIGDCLVPLQNMARHVSRTDSKLDDMRIWRAWPAYLIEYQIEELKAWGRWHEAIRPSAHKCSVMKFVLSTNEPAHVDLSIHRAFTPYGVGIT